MRDIEDLLGKLERALSQRYQTYPEIRRIVGRGALKRERVPQLPTAELMWDEILHLIVGDAASLRKLSRCVVEDKPAVAGPIAELIDAVLAQVLRPDVKPAPDPGVVELVGLAPPRVELTVPFGRDLRQAMLDRADLSNAKLSGTDLRYARLNGADLRGADLRQADLTGASLLGARVSGAMFHGARLRRAAFTSAVGMPSALPGTDSQGVALPGVGRPVLQTGVAMTEVTAIAIDHLGDLLYSTGGDGTLRVWQVDSGLTIRIDPVHSGSANCVALSRDSHHYLTGGDDGYVRYWDGGSGRLIGERRLHTASVNSVAFSASGRLICSGGDDGVVALWDTSSNQISLLSKRGSPVLGVTFASDTVVVVRAGSAAAQLWTSSDRKPLMYEAHIGVKLHSVAASVDGNLVAFGGASGQVRLLDRAGGAISTIGTHGDTVRAVALSFDNEWVASAGDDSMVQLSAVGRRHDRLILREHQKFVLTVAFGGQGQVFASGGEDKTIRVWSVEKESALRVLTDRTPPLRACAIGSGGRFIASTGADGDARIWDADTGRLRRQLRGPGGGARTVAFAAAGQWLAIGGDSSSVRVMSIDDATVLHELGGHRQPVRGLAFAPWAPVLAVADGQSVRVWDAAEDGGSLLANFDFPDSPVWAVAFSPQGQWLAAAGDDHVVRIWSTVDWRLHAELTDHTNIVCALAFSADGKRLLSGGNDRQLRIWEPRTRRLVKVLPPRPAAITALTFLDQDRRLLVGCADRTMWMYDPSKWAPPQGLSGHIGEVRSLAAAGRSPLVCSAGSDGSLRVWHWDGSRLVPRAWLMALAEGGHAVVKDDLGVKITGTVAGEFWFAQNMTRIEAADLVEYTDVVTRLPMGHRIFEPSRH